MSKKNGVLIVGALMVLMGVIDLIRGDLFKIPSNPYPSQRMNYPGIIFLVLGILTLFFGIKNRKSI